MHPMGKPPRQDHPPATTNQLALPDPQKTCAKNHYRLLLQKTNETFLNSGPTVQGQRLKLDQLP
jgi:hypothetical protein